MKKYIAVFMLVVVLFACDSKSKVSIHDFNKEVYVPRYAKGFKILGSEQAESTIILTTNPWQGSDNVEMLYFVARNGEKAPKGFNGQIIAADAGRIVSMSSTYIGILDALGEFGRIVGVSGMDYIMNEYIQDNKDRIKDIPYDINYELLLSTNSDLVLLYGINEAQNDINDKLEDLSIPYMYVGEYMEENPLGKAEWMVVFGEIFNNLEAAVSIFEKIEERYLNLKEMVALALANKDVNVIDEKTGIVRRPTVMLNTPWNDTWVLPHNGSYAVRLIKDAGGDYIYKDNNTKMSLPIGFETAYTLIDSADYWIHLSNITKQQELFEINPKFKDVRTVKENRLYNNNKRLSDGGGNDYWESGVVHPDLILRDLVKIFYPKLIKDDFYYYRHIEN